MKQVKGIRKASFGASVMVVAAVMTALLSGCSDKKTSGGSQVAAKVNKEELSVHQINFVLQRTPGAQADKTGGLSKRILETLIDQELAVQQARELKLDRDPNVIMTLEAGRREILARAYADKVAGSASKPTPAEITQYFEGHPNLFSKRRVYAMQQVQIEANAEQQGRLKSQLESAKNIEQITALLRQGNFKFNARSITVAPENMAADMVAKLLQMSEGQSIINTSAEAIAMVLISGIKAAPLTQEQAKSAIENRILLDRKQQLLGDDLKSLRKNSKIQYVGQFAEGAPEASTAGSSPASAAAPSKPEGGLDESALKSGISGLK